jgi:hypothetical protein
MVRWREAKTRKRVKGEKDGERREGELTELDGFFICVSRD